MMPGNLFLLEMASALGDRRRLALRTGIGILLALPFIFVDMPARAKASGVTMVILFTSFFGAAVHHARLRADQRLARLHLLPTRRSVLWLDLVLASMLGRLGPALVVLVCFVLVNGQGLSGGDFIGVAGLLCGALLMLTLLGMAVGWLARSNGEVHLFGALVAALVALASGIMPVSDRLTWLATAGAWNPVARLLATLSAQATGPAAMAPAEFGAAAVILVVVAATSGQRWASGNCRTAVADCGLPRAPDANTQSEIRSRKSSLEA